MRPESRHPARFALCGLLAASFACASSKAGPATTDGPAAATSCASVGSSTLDGACISFPETAGTWTLAQAAAGIDVPYVVIIEAEIPKVVTRPQDAGHCGSPGPSGLDVFERLDGNDQRYCLCDGGLCPSPPGQPSTIPPGRTAQTFHWTGTNWDGGSDTSNPLGPPFPAGVYTLEVSAVGTVDGEPFEVRNRFEITLIP